MRILGWLHTLAAKIISGEREEAPRDKLARAGSEFARGAITALMWLGVIFGFSVLFYIHPHNGANALNGQMPPQVWIRISFIVSIFLFGGLTILLKYTEDEFETPWKYALAYFAISFGRLLIFLIFATQWYLIPQYEDTPGPSSLQLLSHYTLITMDALTLSYWEYLWGLRTAVVDIGFSGLSYDSPTYYSGAVQAFKIGVIIYGVWAFHKYRVFKSRKQIEEEKLARQPPSIWQIPPATSATKTDETTSQEIEI